MKTTPSIKSAFAYAQSSIKDAARAITVARRRLADNRALLRKIAQACSPIEVSLTALYGVRVSATLDDLEGFKDERLQAVLARLVDLGPEGEKTADYPDYLNRDYTFTFAGASGETITVCVVAYVTGDSPTCRKVLKSVSTRVVEDKTYELVCD